MDMTTRLLPEICYGDLVSFMGVRRADQLSFPTLISNWLSDDWLNLPAIFLLRTPPLVGREGIPLPTGVQ